MRSWCKPLSSTAIFWEYLDFFVVKKGKMWTEKSGGSMYKNVPEVSLLIDELSSPYTERDN